MKNFVLILLVALCSDVQAQLCSSGNITLQDSVASTCFEITLTMQQDNLDRPYVYVASKEGGLKIYDITSEASLVATIPITAFENLHVMNLTQQGYYVYLALGNHFSAGQQAGIAVVDVTMPDAALVTDYWTNENSDHGAGIVAVEGNYAYLGAMDSGIDVLNIADPTNIQFVSNFLPDVNFPDPTPDLEKINARGMQVLNDIVYLCYDAGGFRTIDATDKANLMPMDEYSNPVLDNLPRAYNNIVVDMPYAYIAVDYCGMEVFNISDPTNITAVSWWNPWHCETNPLNWFSSNGHTNEIAMDTDCNLIFMSTGKSDLNVVDVSDPTMPDSCTTYGGINNNLGTWGVSRNGHNLYLSYICAVIPFASNWTGVKMLTYEGNCDEGVNEEIFRCTVMPNPTTDFVSIQSNGALPLAVEVLDCSGKMLQSIASVQGRIELPQDAGVYFLKVHSSFGSSVTRIVKTN
ncbi:MAG: T9SS type A sorting domain-containing protein [Flavobacteriales bacterium]